MIRSIPAETRGRAREINLLRTASQHSEESRADISKAAKKEKEKSFNYSQQCRSLQTLESKEHQKEKVALKAKRVGGIQKKSANI